MIDDLEIGQGPAEAGHYDATLRSASAAALLRSAVLALANELMGAVRQELTDHQVVF
jgi:hypothetical protein